MAGLNFNGYFIGVKEGKPLCGNAGTQRNHYVQQSKIHQTADRMAHMYGLDEVWLIYTYSQRMCEMEPDEFVTQVHKIGTRII